MSKWLMILMAVILMQACENTEGQYRHDKNHHKRQIQKIIWFKFG